MLILLAAILLPSVFATTSFNGFIDTYYAYDFNHSTKRKFTTQPLRHNEPNINLAYGDITVKEEKYRGRLAFQGGNSVDANYILEPGQSKYIQESYLGFKIGDKTWLDGGIFLGNIGMESWISKDNYTYSRSLMLDYVPYYSAGLRLEHSLSDEDSFQLQIINGWQNISETNKSKALGFQYKKKIKSHLTFTYNNFLGDEAVYKFQKSRFRSYHNFILHYHSEGSYTYLGSIDFGEQSQQNKSGQDPWYALGLVIKRMLNETHSVSVRAEYYNDRHQSNVITGTKNGFQVTGFSTNYDIQFKKVILFRNEVRTLISRDRIFDDKYVDTFFVTSLALSI